RFDEWHPHRRGISLFGERFEARDLFAHPIERNRLTCLRVDILAIPHALKRRRANLVIAFTLFPVPCVFLREVEAPAHERLLRLCEMLGGLRYRVAADVDPLGLLINWCERLFVFG